MLFFFFLTDSKQKKAKQTMFIVTGSEPSTSLWVSAISLRDPTKHNQPQHYKDKLVNWLTCSFCHITMFCWDTLGAGVDVNATGYTPTAQTLCTRGGLPFLPFTIRVMDKYREELPCQKACPHPRQVTAAPLFCDYAFLPYRGPVFGEDHVSTCT